MIPFLRWLGGKQRLVPSILPLLPADLNRRVYHEPFLGAGAVLLNVLPTPKAAYVSDINWALVETWRALRANCRGVLAELAELQRNTTREAFELARAELNEFLTAGSSGAIETRLAAVFIYVNKTCFNGLYRVNKSGRFNTPWGKRENATVYTEEHIKQVAETLFLGNATIQVKDYADALRMVDVDDVVYLDPPYPPTSKTANFTSFTADGFDGFDQQQLWSAIHWLDKKGALFILSMPAQDFVRDLYRGFVFHEVSARRSVSATAGGRGMTSEWLITNY